MPPTLLSIFLDIFSQIPRTMSSASSTLNMRTKHVLI
jgi:hypothetical protein